MLLEVGLVPRPPSFIRQPREKLGSLGTRLTGSIVLE